MIEIVSRCGHLRDLIKGIVMRVIIGEIAPSPGEAIVIPCPVCGKIWAFVHEVEHDEPRRRAR